MVFLTTLLFSLFLTISLIPIFSRLAFKLKLVDIPDARKIHSEPMPRTGGICMVLGTLIPTIFLLAEHPFTRWFLVSVLILFISGLVDDMRGHGPWTKFLAQILAASVIIIFGSVRIEHLGALLPEGLFLPPYISILLTLITIVGVTNAINLADGLDGLAGGICLLIFACLTFIAYLLDNTVVAILSVAITGAVFGFLHFNTHPATIFMGDTGSQFLGFAAITLSIKLSQEEAALSPLLPLLLLGFPVLDTITVMLQRYQEGRPLFRADKNHFHHKLIGLGFSHTEAVLIIYAIQAFLTLFAFVLRFHSEWLILIGYILFGVFVTGAITIATQRGYKFTKGGFLDRIEKIREWKRKGIIIKFAFPIIEIGIPALFLLSSFVPKEMNRYISYLGLAYTGIIVILLKFYRKHLGLALRICLYFLIPYVIYMGDSDPIPLMKNGFLRVFYNFSFFVFAVFIVLTIRFSRRRQGFKTTPMDFLILFFVVIVVSLPISEIKSYHTGLVAAKVITLFYSYEVIMGELRSNFKRLTGFTIATLLVVFIRGIKSMF